MTQARDVAESPRTERQVTHAPGGHILTNTGVWSPDSQWIIYDTRSDPAGSLFDGKYMAMAHCQTGEVKLLYEARHDARCGVASFHPHRATAVLILGPENPTPDWSYNACHRQGVLVDAARPGLARPLDGRDLTPPFTPGALRGGSHVHVWDAQGQWLSFTYEDHLLAQFPHPSPDNDINQRNVGVCFPKPVRVPKTHPRNHDGDYFSVLVTRTVALPQPGSDDILRACEEGWVGREGYVLPDGTRQRRALAFQGEVLTRHGERIQEVFLVDLPDDLSRPGDGPLAGTETRRPLPPRGTVQRRLTYTAHRPYPGLQGPRHWLRSSPDGSRIACFMRDDTGLVQLWMVSPNGGTPEQLTQNPWSITSAYSWSPDGRSLAYTMDNSVFITDAATGQSTRLTLRSPDNQAPRPEACVFSPDGKKIACVRQVLDRGRWSNQIFVVHLTV